MVQGNLLLRVEKNRKYLVLVPLSFEAAQVQALGFTSCPPNPDIPSAHWRKAASGFTARQVLNLLPDAKIDEAVQHLILSDFHSNYRLCDGSIAKNDAALKDYQRPAVTHLASHKRAMLALAPGLGKTLCALRASQAAGYKRLLIVAPLSLLDNWRKEIRIWLPHSTVAVCLAGGVVEKYIDPSPERIIYLVNYESLPLFYARIKSKSNIDLIVFDESVLLKNRDTKRVKYINELLKGYVGAIWLLSGGPVTKYLDDMWSQLHILDRKRFSSYWNFTNYYCVVEQDQWGMHITGDKPGAHELLKKDILDIYYAKTQDEVEDLPPFIEREIEVEMDSEQTRLYTQMEKEFLASLSEDEDVIATNVLTQLLRLTQIASCEDLLGEIFDPAFSSSAKWAAVAELVEFEAKPILIWTNFLRTMDALEVKLSPKYRVDMLSGRTKKEHRQWVVDNFQHGNIDVVIAHPGVGKYGHTLTAARTVLYVERSYSGDDFYQSLYRVRRIGTTVSPNILFLLSTRAKLRTVDHAIHDVLAYKHANNIKTISSGALRRAWAGELK